MKKDICNMTIKEFRELPVRGWNYDVGEFDSLVILPVDGRSLHDSGYRCMDFVAVRGSDAIIRLSGCSDVVHVGGIGGYGRRWAYIGHTIIPTGWSIDCLPKSGLLRLFCGKPIVVAEALSSFEVYANDKKEAINNEEKKDAEVKPQNKSGR